MTFESDSLIDRKRLKRRLANWRLAAVIAVAGVGLALFARFDAGQSQDHVTRLAINGIILEEHDRTDRSGQIQAAQAALEAADAGVRVQLAQHGQLQAFRRVH